MLIIKFFDKKSDHYHNNLYIMTKLLILLTNLNWESDIVTLSKENLKIK